MIKIRKAIKVTNDLTNSFKNSDRYPKVWRIVYTSRMCYVYIRLPFDADKLEIETIDREFLALVHLSYEIESSNGQKKIRGARNR